MVGRQWYVASIELHLGVHYRKRYPGVCTGHELSEQFQVESCRMASTFVVAVVHHLYVVHGVGDEISESLVIGFCCKLKWTVIKLEAVVECRYEMY